MSLHLGIWRAFLLVAVIFAEGCTYFTRPAEQPIIEKSLELKSRNDELDIVDTLAIEATRRLLVANLNDQTYCAEPPPDVAETVARSLATSIGVGLEQGDIDAEAAAEFALNYQTAIEQLSPLTQGLKFSRDAYFALCQARANWFMSNEDFFTIFVDIVARASVLIAEEIPLLTQRLDSSQASVDPVDVESTANKILEAMPVPEPSEGINDASPSEE